MGTVNLSEFDQDVRGALTRAIAELGHAPELAELARTLDAEPGEIERSLLRLQDAHALHLHPGSCDPWAVHPFALSPGGCWVETDARGYWANCLYCAFGIVAAVASDARITTRFGGEGETAIFTIADGAPREQQGVFHLSTPAARWWPNVIHACASFQPFRAEAEIDGWCARHRLPKGAVMTIPALWSFASEWYGGYLQHPWRKRTPDEVRALFARHGLTSAFWEV